MSSEMAWQTGPHPKTPNLKKRRSGTKGRWSNEKMDLTIGEGLERRVNTNPDITTPEAILEGEERFETVP